MSSPRELMCNRRFEPYDLNWCRRKRFSTANIVHLLNGRELGYRKEGSNFIKGSREFYHGLTIKRSVQSAERPQFFPLRFTPDGSKLIGIGPSFQEIHIFTYRGVQFGANCPTNQIFNAVFPKRVIVQFWDTRENPRSLERLQFGILSKECAFITPDSDFLIVSASIQIPENRSIFDGIIRNNESLSPDTHLMNTTFYSIDLKKGNVLDKRKFEFDEIRIQSGVYLLEWTLAILSVHHQTIHLIGIDRQTGQLLPLKCIGPSTLDDDQLWDAGLTNPRTDRVFTDCAKTFYEQKIDLIASYKLVVNEKNPYWYYQLKITLNINKVGIHLAFRQRFITFLYKEHVRNGQIQRFLYQMEYFKNMKMQKLQFLGPEFILIRMDLHSRQNDMMSGNGQQNFMFVLLEWRQGQIVGVFDRCSEQLFGLYEWHNEYFMNGHLPANHFPHSMEHSGHALDQHNFIKESSLMSISPADTRRRFLSQLPIVNCQHFTSTAYLDPEMFSFNERLIGFLEKGRFPLEKSLILFSRKTRSRHTKLEFYADPARVYPSCYARVLFHPSDPFVISICRGTQPDTLISFHMS